MFVNLWNGLKYMKARLRLGEAGFIIGRYTY